MTVQDPPPPTRRSMRGPRGRSSDVATPTFPVDDPAPLPVADVDLSGIPRTEDSEAVPARVAAASMQEDSDAAVTPVSAAAAVPVAEPVYEPVYEPTEVAPASVVTSRVVIPTTAALAWVSPEAVASRARPMLQLEQHPTSFVPATADLLERAPRRTPWRPGVLVPIGVVVALIAVYCATTLLWPLHAVAPTVSEATVQPVTSATSNIAWPDTGSGGVEVAGFGTPVASTDQAAPIASLTKLVTALMVLDEAPLAVGEQGPEYSFVYADYLDYLNAVYNGESALDVPVGGTLTEYQMLQGLLMGSANNYGRYLADMFWSNDTVFATAANTWLSQRGISGVTIADPTGLDADNAATPTGLMLLAERAMANPVIAEIVGTRSVELPGAGLVENTNPLLEDPGVVGMKTGTLENYNLLVAKNIMIGDTTVRVYAASTDQPDRDTRDAVARSLLDQLEQALQLTPSVAAGTVVGRVETLWGDDVPVVTSGDASVVLWNGTTATETTTFDLGEQRATGENVGELVATGPLNSASVPLVLDGDITDPSPLWRLTHPLQLFGLA